MSKLVRREFKDKLFGISNDPEFKKIIEKETIKMFRFIPKGNYSIKPEEEMSELVLIDKNVEFESIECTQEFFEYKGEFYKRNSFDWIIPVEWYHCNSEWEIIEFISDDTELYSELTTAYTNYRKFLKRD